MTTLVVGLLIFLGAHSIRIFADDWRAQRVARIGERRWKAAYSIVAVVGFVLICWGYAQARSDPVEVYAPPIWGRHLAIPLTFVAFVLLAATHGPPTRIKAAVHHPMVLGVIVWAVAHLLANGRREDILLFGAFLVWGLADFASAWHRDRVAGTVYRQGALRNDAVTVVLGAIIWLVFAMWLHQWLIGVRPLP